MNSTPRSKIFFIISALECFLYLLGAHNLSTAMYIFHFTKFAWLTFFPRHTASCAEFFSVMSVLLILAYEIGSFLSALRVFDFFIILEVVNFFPSVCQNCLNIFKQTFHVRIVQLAILGRQHFNEQFQNLFITIQGRVISWKTLGGIT